MRKFYGVFVCSGQSSITAKISVTSYNFLCGRLVQICRGRIDAIIIEHCVMPKRVLYRVSATANVLCERHGLCDLYNPCEDGRQFLSINIGWPNMGVNTPELSFHPQRDY